MKGLRTFFAKGLAALVLLAPAALSTAARADNLGPAQVHTVFTVIYRWGDGRPNDIWVVYENYYDGRSAQAVSDWLQANWLYQTFIWVH